MCGIAGLINLNGDPVSLSLLRKMTDAIKHRGPDGEGQWIDNNVGIGHRRLAIIDLTSAGHQPMSSLDDRYILSYNGEVYNFKEIRDELKTIGYKFKSQSDTEVVLNSLVHWGKDALLKFNGMFAFALWDKKEKTLLIGRDRYGIKPLYYSFQKNTFAFGSEQKAITAQTNFIRKVNKPALFEYFTFQNIFTNQTLMKDIYLLPAGYFGVLNLLKNKTPKLEITKYWDYNFSEPIKNKSKRDYVEELKHLFTQAVERQMISDVEIGSYLSGGMDSGSITAIASNNTKYLKTFTCGFDLSSASGVELNFDERESAEMMSNFFKTKHYDIILKSGDMERCLNKLSHHLEEPRVGQSYPNFYAAKLAGKFVKVVLSGSGGDELFGGYPWRYYRSVSAQNFDEYIDQYYVYWQRLVDNTELKKMFAPSWNEVNHVWTRDIFKNVFSKQDSSINTPEDFINHSLYFEAKTFLHGLFIVEDKLSMAHNLESRVPFMDNDLVDFAMKCPVNLKLNNLKDVINLNENDFGNKRDKYFQKTNDGKQILRDMMKNLIPDEIIKAKKQGFSSPDSSWFKGESINFVKKTIIDKNAKIYDIIDRDTVVSLVDKHFNGSENRRLLIWSLLNVETILKDF